MIFLCGIFATYSSPFKELTRCKSYSHLHVRTVEYARPREISRESLIRLRESGPARCFAASASAWKIVPIIQPADIYDIYWPVGTMDRYCFSIGVPSRTSTRSALCATWLCVCVANVCVLLCARHTHACTHVQDSDPGGVTTGLFMPKGHK